MLLGLVWINHAVMKLFCTISSRATKIRSKVIANTFIHFFFWNCFLCTCNCTNFFSGNVIAIYLFSRILSWNLSCYLLVLWRTAVTSYPVRNKFQTLFFLISLRIIKTVANASAQHAFGYIFLIHFVDMRIFRTPTVFWFSLWKMVAHSVQSISKMLWFNEIRRF